MSHPTYNAPPSYGQYDAAAFENSDQHRNFNYHLCDAINITSLTIVLDRMVEAKKIDPNTAKLYLDQARGLLHIILTENNRNHGF